MKNKRRKQTRNLEADLLKAWRKYEAKFRPRKISDNIVRIYVKNEDGTISRQLKILKNDEVE